MKTHNRIGRIISQLRLTGLKARLVVSSIFISVLIFSIYLLPENKFPHLFGFGMILLGAVALGEYYSIIEKRGFKPYKILGITLFSLTLLSFYCVHWIGCNLALPIGVFVFGFIFLALNGLKTPKDAISTLSTSLFGIIYLMFGFLPLLAIAYFIPENGDVSPRIWISFLFLNTKLSDTFAYFIGKNFGKTKLCPKISPRKTWEGTFGTLLSGLITPFLVLPFFTAPISTILFVSFSVLLAFFGLLGDLVESLIKRDAGVKDSNEIPGLGGILDIFDSIIFAAPLLYLFLLGVL